jgi:hypothetical protein
MYTNAGAVSSTTSAMKLNLGEIQLNRNLQLHISQLVNANAFSNVRFSGWGASVA